jgi:membrane fusion protein (multidrug efflux system)
VPPAPAEAAATPEPKGKSSKRPLIILGAVVTAMVLGIGGYALSTAGQENTDDAQVEADVVPMGARVGGQIAKLLVHDNQTVKAGDVLIELDKADFSAREKQAEAELLTAKAQAAVADAQTSVTEASARGGLSTAKALFSGSGIGVATAEANIAGAKANLTRAEADARRTQLDLDRAKELRAANAVSQERLDNAQAARDGSAANLVAAQAQLSASLEQRRGAEAHVAEAKGRLDQSAPIDAQIAGAHAAADLAHARVAAAEAMLELAKNQLSYADVTAPSDGVISRLSVHAGQLIQPGQPIAELVPKGTYVVANFKETQVGKITPGQSVEIAVDAFPGKKLEGTVESVSGGTGARFSLMPPDNASGNFVKVVQRVPVRIVWKTLPEGLVLRAGLSADVTVKVR